MDERDIPGLQERVSVWRAVAALGDYRVKDALWPEVVCAVVIGGGGSALVVRGGDLASRVAVIGDVLVLAGALLAVVFAALAVVVSLPSTKYLRLLGETPGTGMRTFLDPFLVAVGTQVGLIIASLAYRFAAIHIAWWIEHVAFYAIASIFVFGVLDIAGLARQLVRHGVLRAAAAALDDDGGEVGSGEIRRLPERRG